MTGKCFVYRLTRHTRYSATAWARSSRTRCASRSKLEAGPTTGPGPSRRRCTCVGCARRRSAARRTTQTPKIRRCPNSTAPTFGPRSNVGTALTPTSTRTPRSRIGSFPNSKESFSGPHTHFLTQSPSTPGSSSRSPPARTRRGAPPQAAPAGRSTQLAPQGGGGQQKRLQSMVQREVRALGTRRRALQVRPTRPLHTTCGRLCCLYAVYGHAGQDSARAYGGINNTNSVRQPRRRSQSRGVPRAL